jgi:ribosome-associated protein
MTVPRIDLPQEELEFSYVRSSGAGGQNVNKVNSKAVLRWHPASSLALPEAVRDRFLQRYASRLNSDGSLLITSDRYRDQGRNAADCIDKLRALIAIVWLAPKPRRLTRPTRASKERRLQQKRERAETKRGRGDQAW